jgi:ABC-type Fe3+/spermidine/putrescine transport system ATPase subunit
MRLIINELSKDYHRELKNRSENDRPALNKISLAIEDGSFFTLLGPSGCGKTTLLRSIAGLEVPDSGEIQLGERVLFSSSGGINIPPSRRNLGMVFQSYAIWPHFDVAGNVAYPLTVGARRRLYSRADVNRRVRELLDLIRIGHLANRKATTLSSGQQQRLAVARALVMEPPVLLLDEPLSNLDTRLRQDLRVELMRLQKTLGFAAVYVTHDQSEALAMSSSVAVMRDGAVEQLGTPQEIYDYPRTRFVAAFLGSANLLKARILASSSGGTDHGIECLRFDLETDWGAPIAAFGRVPFAAGTTIVLEFCRAKVKLSARRHGLAWWRRPSSLAIQSNTRSKFAIDYCGHTVTAASNSQWEITSLSGCGAKLALFWLTDRHVDLRHDRVADFLFNKGIASWLDGRSVPRRSDSVAIAIRAKAEVAGVWSNR